MVLQKFSKPGREKFKILDLGCGTGRYSIFFTVYDLDNFARHMSYVMCRYC